MDRIKPTKVLMSAMSEKLNARIRKIEKLVLIVIIAMLPFVTSAQSETDSTGFAGDHFSLEGAMDIFKNSKSPEDFEKRLNDPKNTINNLDLNEDGNVDYIRVIDHAQGDVHAIVLQVPINENESQDIAVIEIEKTGKESAILQIIGDEEIYGEQVIAEPFEEEEGQNKKGNGGPYVEFDAAPARIVVNVYFWLPVRYIYGPNYVIWISPWRWMYYPHWWSPWHPHPWRVHWNHTRIYHRHYHVVNTHRVVNAHRIYAPRRSRSVTVVKKTTVVRTNKKAAPNVKAGRNATKVGVQKDSPTKRAKKKTKKVGVSSEGQTTRVGTKTTKVGVQKDGQTTRAGQTTTKVGAKKEGDKVTVGKKTTRTGVQKSGNTKVGKKTATRKTVKKVPRKTTVKKTKTVKKGRKKGS